MENINNTETNGTEELNGTSQEAKTNKQTKTNKENKMKNEDRIRMDEKMNRRKMWMERYNIKVMVNVDINTLTNRKEAEEIFLKFLKAENDYFIKDGIEKMDTDSLLKRIKLEKEDTLRILALR